MSTYHATSPSASVGSSDPLIDVHGHLEYILAQTAVLDPGNASSPLKSPSETLLHTDWFAEIDFTPIKTSHFQALDLLNRRLSEDILRLPTSLEAPIQALLHALENNVLRGLASRGSLSQSALEHISKTLDQQRTHVARLATDLVDKKVFETIHQVFQTLESLANGTAFSGEELTQFLCQNLVGLKPNHLDGPAGHLDKALAFLEIFSNSTIQARLGEASERLSNTFTDLAERFTLFDGEQEDSYTSLTTHLQECQNIRDVAFDALESMYATWTSALADPSWDRLFQDYAAVLNAMDLQAIPTVDDAIDTLATLMERLALRLGMVLDPEALAEQIQQLSQSIHQHFAQSGLSQVRQILLAQLNKIREALESIPSEAVIPSFTGMANKIEEEIRALNLGAVRDEMRLGIERAKTQMLQAIQDATAACVALVPQAKTFDAHTPFASASQILSSAFTELTNHANDLNQQLTLGMEHAKQLLSSLDTIDYKPFADQVIDEIHVVKKKLQAIKPNTLSQGERIAIAAGLTVLNAVDIEGLVETKLKTEYAELDSKVVNQIRAAQTAWLAFKERVGTLDPSKLTGPLSNRLAMLEQHLQKDLGNRVLAPMDKAMSTLQAKLVALNPESLLRPLEAPFASLTRKLDGAITSLDANDPHQNPLLRLKALHERITQTIQAIDLVPLLKALDEREQQFFQEIRDTILNALEQVRPPAPLVPLYDQIKALLGGLTMALFGDAETTLKTFSVNLTSDLRPSSLFHTLDAAFDRLVAALERLPEQEVVQALETIRHGLGSTLAHLDPGAVMATMRAAMGRLETSSLALLPGTMDTQGWHIKIQGRLSNRAELAGVRTQLEAQLTLVFAPLDLMQPGSRARRLIDAHNKLVDAMRLRLRGLETSGAEGAYHRLSQSLHRLLPDFLAQPNPLDMPTIRSGLAAMRPSAKAQRLDQAVDRFFKQLAPLEQALNTSVNAFFAELRQAALMLHPSGLIETLSHVNEPLLAHLANLDPMQLAAPIKACLEAIKQQVNALDPAPLQTSLETMHSDFCGAVAKAYQTCSDAIRAAIDAFLQGAREFLKHCQDEIQQLSTNLAAPVNKAIESISALIEEDIFKRLLTMLENLKSGFERELERVRREFDAMLAAIPLGVQPTLGVS